ncbi:TetR/AcrR family transcriptional regulator [Pseudocolwellia sp. HL-MZ19]|uniref:TetR/AcrR family transcriptional regulator n=1 Tax=unclassified Pseudocolwellia TaxID=2848178 RepID=UPI003CEC8643
MRDAEQTRQKILDISADEIHKHGYTATSLSVILKRCEISKGALYHHFTNKIELGYAVFEEIYTPMFLSTWLAAIEHDDPIEGLCDYFSQMSVNMTCDELICGCPLNNLCQEMASVDEGFRLRILDLQLQLNKLISDGLEKIQHQLRNDINFSQVSYFIVSTFHGSTTLSKSSKNVELFEQVMNELCKYLRNLKQA